MTKESFTENHETHNHEFTGCIEALAQYRKKKNLHRGEKIDLAAEQQSLKRILLDQGIFTTKEDRVDVYNPSITFKVHGSEYIVGRAEPSNDEHASSCIFFRHEGESWIPLEKPILQLQDPNVTWIDGQMIVSGVELEHNEETDEVLYRMAFYKGKNFDDLTLATVGPWGMKGIRLAKLADGSIGIYTRPQGKKGGNGQIGFTTTDSLDTFIEQTQSIIQNAPLLDEHFPEDEWGGVNQILPMADGGNLVIGHRAYRDDKNNRHYYPWAFEHNPFSNEVKDLGILAERSDFPPGRSKAPDLQDVVYTSGLIKKDDQWFLLVGLSDTQTGVIQINQSYLNATSKKT